MENSSNSAVFTNDRRNNPTPYPECFGKIEEYVSPELAELRKQTVLLEQILAYLKPSAPQAVAAYEENPTPYPGRFGTATETALQKALQYSIICNSVR